MKSESWKVWKERFGKEIEVVLGISVKVKLGEPKSIERI